MFRFSLCDTEPPFNNLIDGFPDAGALASFEGRVRNNNEGKVVSSLEYSAYSELAQTEGTRILVEASARFGILAATAFHRVGHLSIGDLTIRIDVCSEHRKEAFSACSWILDEIKSRLPIWKKEWYQNGESAWVACSHRPETTFNESPNILD